MKISVFSFFMATVFGSLLSWMLYRIRKKNLYSGRTGIAWMVLLYLFCLVRMLVPMDFPFTQGIYLDKGTTWIYDQICLKKFGVGMLSVSIAELLAALWLCVAGILIILFFRDYRKTWKQVVNMDKKTDRGWENCLAQVAQNKGKRMGISVYRCSQVQSPMGLGIKKRLILLPDQEYEERELYYILLHEYTHFLNHDLLVKMLVQIYCCIFWWNPISYLLRKDLEQSLEIKCDLCVTESLSGMDVSDYLQTIVNTIKNARGFYTCVSHGTAALAKGEKSEIAERFRIVADNQRRVKKKNIAMAFWSVMFLAAILASYAVIPLPSFEPPTEEIETEPDTYELSPESSYLLEDGKGGYRWVMDGVMDDKISKELAEDLMKEGFQVRREK